MAEGTFGTIFPDFCQIYTDACCDLQSNSNLSEGISISKERVNLSEWAWGQVLKRKMASENSKLHGEEEGSWEPGVEIEKRGFSILGAPGIPPAGYLAQFDALKLPVLFGPCVAWCPPESWSKQN